MKDKILECVDGFEAIWQLAEPAFTRAKNARFAYEQARAKEWTRIVRESEKKPSDDTIKEMVTVAVAAEQNETRTAAEELEAIKFHAQLIRDSLSAYQTAAKFEDTERQMASVGAYGS